MTRPARSASNGLEADSGLSLYFVQTAPETENNASESGVANDSAEPQIMTSARSSWISLQPSMTDWVPVAQAVDSEESGPLKPLLMPTRPATMLPMKRSTVCGYRSSGFSLNTSICRMQSVPSKPAVPNEMPVLDSSRSFMPRDVHSASPRASSAATQENMEDWLIAGRSRSLKKRDGWNWPGSFPLGTKAATLQPMRW